MNRTPGSYAYSPFNKKNPQAALIGVCGFFLIRLVSRWLISIYGKKCLSDSMKPLDYFFSLLHSWSLQ